MLAIAKDVRPEWVCLVPEKRQEITTEGGLDVIANGRLPSFVRELQQVGILVSLFIDPDIAQIDRAIDLGSDAIEIHTGTYAERHLAGGMTLPSLPNLSGSTRRSPTPRCAPLTY